MADTDTDELTPEEEAEALEFEAQLRTRAAQWRRHLADPIVAQMRALGVYPLHPVAETLLELFPEEGPGASPPPGSASSAS